MNHLFISPILLEYPYLEELVNEAILKLKLDLDQTGKEEFKKSVFFNFNRYLVLQIDLLQDEKREKLYDELTFFIENKNEKETINLLTEWEILPEARSEFVDLLLNIKK
ncbi:MAG: hypothetical protein PF488_00785 [Patescibacteria group bacterium]|jgi:hypothetical protein|nr:hypothetical protein [Patescibacteria group bacterium]